MNAPHAWRSLIAASLAFGTVSLTGCPAPTNPTTNPVSPDTTNVDVQSDATSLISDMSDFEASLTQSAAELSAAADTGAGASIQSLDGESAPYHVQDVSGAYSAGYPSAAGTSLANAISAGGWLLVNSSLNQASPSLVPNWMKDGSGNVRYPKVFNNGTIGGATESYYVSPAATDSKGPFAYSHTVVHDGTTVLDQFALPEVASDSIAALPAPFNTMPNLPASVRVRQAALTFFTYGGPNSSALGYRWALHDASASNKPLVAWCRALQITRNNPAKNANQTVLHYDVATQYTTEPDPTATNPNATRRVPYESISDDTNSTAGTQYHMDKVYTAANTTWTGNGTFTKGSVTRTVQETWNISTNARTKTTSWTTAKGVKVVMALSFAANRSGTGTITANGTQIATMTWGKNGQGTMTLASGQTSKFQAHY